MTDPRTLTDIVAIDGPAGAGKSTVARRVAERLGYAFLDTGAMYRAVTWAAMHEGIDLDDPTAVLDVARAMTLRLTDEHGRFRVTVDGTDVTEAIRRPDVTANIYQIDQLAPVRALLVELQRDFAAQRPTVAEGRDMGTVVFPYAKCKVFLDATLEERTRRRAAELIAKGVLVTIDALQSEIHERDEKGRRRAVSPLVQAEDAVFIDTTGKTLDEVVTSIVTLARAVCPC